MKNRKTAILAILSIHVNTTGSFLSAFVTKPTIGTGFFLSRDKRCLAGVTIKPYGLNTSYFWPERLLGKPIESTTDKNGLASLEYPLLFRAFEMTIRPL